MTPGDPVVGSTILRRPAIQSPNFVQSPLQGWAINADGSAYFANVTAEGTITATSLSGGTVTGATITGSTFDGTDFIINSSGAFFYSATPAAGNLIASVAPAAGADSFGNNYLRGHATYGAAFATSLDAGFVSFYTGSLAGGWTSQATIETDAGGDLLLAANASVALTGTSVTINGNANTGACNNNLFGLTTSGASAGTAHTHTLPFQNPTATHTHPL